MNDYCNGPVWSVEVTYPGRDCSFLIGRFWDLGTERIPANFSGYTKAVFKTREMARQVARNINYGKARVVKVSVSVEKVEA